MSIPFEIVEVPEVTALVRRRSCAHHEIAKTIMDLFRETAEANPDADMIGPPMIKYLAWRDADCELESAAPINPGSTVAGPGSEVKTYPTCNAVCHTYMGPYEGLSDAWTNLWNTIMEQNIEGELPCWDTYVTDPSLEPDSSKWITELYIPLKKIV